VSLFQNKVLVNVKIWQKKATNKRSSGTHWKDGGKKSIIMDPEEIHYGMKVVAAMMYWNSASTMQNLRFLRHPARQLITVVGFNWRSPS
jgi:hypothetical protein